MMLGYAPPFGQVHEALMNDWPIYPLTGGPQLLLPPADGNDTHPSGSNSASNITAPASHAELVTQTDPPTTMTATICVACRWNSCTLLITGVPKRLRERLRAHMQDHHLDALSGSDKTCQWVNCVCRTHRRGRCNGLEDSHAAHAKDMITHLWQAHVSSAK
jgi:hypothetical protein